MEKRIYVPRRAAVGHSTFRGCFMSLITLTDLPGTNALAIARRVATRLGIPLIDKDWVYDRFLVPYLSDHEMHLINESPRALLEDFEPGLPRVDYLRRELLAWAAFHNAVCLGFASALLLGEHPFALHVNVRAPLDLCAERVAREQAISLKEATRIVDLVNRQQKRYLRIVHEADATNQMLYHLSLNTDRVSVDVAVDMIVGLYRDAVTLRQLQSSVAGSNEQFTKSEITTMKNPSEIQFSRVLDMYGIGWQYEPKTFPVEYDDEGNVTMAFSPDFYLPHFDLYLELTVMDQRYVSAKNRKARLVQELYPGTEVRVVYRRDFNSLVRRLEEPNREDTATNLSTNPDDYSILFSAEDIEKRLDEIAAEIDRDYPNGLVIVGMLKGSVIFLSDLVRRLTVPVRVDFLRVGAYDYRPGETPLLRIVHDLDVTIYERDVLLVDDFVCTGFETNFVLQQLEMRGPSSLHVCSLIIAPQQQLLPLPLRYSGFEVGFEHLVGYGLDDGYERGRQLPFIARLNDRQDTDNGNGKDNRNNGS